MHNITEFFFFSISQIRTLSSAEAIGRNKAYTQTQIPSYNLGIASICK